MRDRVSLSESLTSFLRHVVDEISENRSEISLTGRKFGIYFSCGAMVLSSCKRLQECKLYVYTTAKTLPRRQIIIYFAEILTDISVTIKYSLYSCNVLHIGDAVESSRYYDIIPRDQEIGAHKSSSTRYIELVGNAVILRINLNR